MVKCEKCGKEIYESIGECLDCYFGVRGIDSVNSEDFSSNKNGEL